MKLTIEQFNFTKLKPTDVLVFEIENFESKPELDEAMKLIQRMKNELKIPKRTFIVIGRKGNPIDFSVIPESEMNRNGWFRKVRVVESFVKRIKELGIKEIMPENASANPEKFESP